MENKMYSENGYFHPQAHELQLDAFVGNIAADLGLDKEQLSDRRLRVASQPSKHYVDINLDNGNLIVKEKIDREKLCGSSPDCVLSLDVVLENPLTLYQVEVEILDVNDNAPSFQKNQIRLEISEIAATGTRFTLESAHDPDIGSNSLQTYQLLPNKYFSLDVQIRSDKRTLPVLVLQRALDREMMSKHKLTVIAKDGGVPVRSGTVQVTITVKDINDNSPVFPQSVYRISLLESVPQGTLVIRLNATDLDDGPNGEIIYSFSSHCSAIVRELFGVDSKTGEIRVKGVLDYERNNAFEINVQAMDKGSGAIPVHCDIFVDIVDVNDNAPEVELRSLTSAVPEHAPLGTIVALFTATDKDSGENGQVQCEIVDQLPFKLESNRKNYYKLLITHLLDRENISRYDVTITCTDAGNPPLTSKKTMRVEVSDINDNTPLFTQPVYMARFMENNIIGASIMSVTAFDPDEGENARLLFSIIPMQFQGTPIANLFSINPQSGEIFAQQPFDYEQLKRFQFQVQVQDSGVPPLTSNVSVDIVILDQNDNAPVIVHPLPDYGSTVTETMLRFAEPGYLVVKVSATDADAGENAHLFYQILQPIHSNLFTISPDTGEVWTIRRITNTDDSKQRLLIMVNDNGTPALSATLTLLLTVVDEDRETFSSVTSLSNDAAFTPDVSLSLSTKRDFITPNPHRPSHSNKSVQNESIGKENIRVMDSDHHSKAVSNEITDEEMVATLRPITVDKYPGREQVSPRTLREAKPEIQIIYLSSRDNFKILCDRLVFIIEVRLRKRMERSVLDRREEFKRRQLYRGGVGGAGDGIEVNRVGGLMFNGVSAIAGRGEIRYSVPEELQPGAFVGKIAADLDLDLRQLSARRLRVAPSPRKLYFDVNLESGVLFVKEIIDREQLCGSNLDCRLSLDIVLEKPLSLYQVEVEVLDVNDNAPYFQKSQYSLNISESAAPGMRFPLEPALDPDIGTNALQSYQLQRNDYFTLDIQMRSGKGKWPVLLLQKPLDREVTSKYILTLTAKDGGLPPRSGTVQIMVTVTDANDNAPVFSQSVYRVSMLENAPAGTLLITLNATDLDEGVNGEITYSFSSHISAAARKLFDLNSKTGQIRLKGKLDYEVSNVLEINIQAMDMGPGSLTEYCDVVVAVTDVNDNAPEVTLRSSSSTVPENSPVGTIVALFSAEDKDSGRNGQVQCHISNQLSFKLDSSTTNYYRILIEHLLDRESTPMYDINIICMDAGDPPLTSKKTVRLEVTDINDNAPKFSRSIYTANVIENNVIGASIFSLTAFDADTGNNSLLKFSVVESQVQNFSIASFVSINSASGVICARRSFDYEQLKSFQIHVQVRDSGEPALKSNASVNVIILDQNDNAPVITHPLPEYGSTVIETISRFAEPGSLVVKVSATDDDAGQNARLSYDIVQAAHRNLFTISAETGEIWTIRRILNRDASNQRLVVVVKDNGIPSLSATVTIMLSVVGTDSETFSRVSSSSSDPILTSELSLSLVIALGIISSLFFIILIILAVKVHKNRNGIVYQHDSLGTCCFESRSSFNGIQKASKSLQMHPNYVEVFGGDPLSQRFRYESCSTLQSIKRDCIVPNNCRISAENNFALNESIKKENTEMVNSEKYSVSEIRYSVPEELQVGAFVGNIATDLGLDLKELSTRRFRVAPSPRKRYVDVNLENGVLFVNERIDREQLCGPSNDCVLSFNLLLANPLGLHQVEVEILDVNDNAPSFPSSQIRLEISEIMAPGARFPLEAAHDPDIGTNSLQRYHLLPNEYFILDIQSRSRKGKLPVLVLQSPLDRETLPTHELTLFAEDGGVPLRSGKAQVTITVKDANDNSPVFSQSVYSVSLLESAAIGTLIITANASDLDVGSNGEITYSLSSHNSENIRELFRVDSKTGEIRLKGYLDYEEVNFFEINIQAVDDGPDAIFQHCDVLVDVIDVNDNAPELTLTSTSSTVPEDASIGTVVALLSVEDKDSGQNGQVRCHISNMLPFKLDSSMKDIYRLLVQHALDRENKSGYDITVTCSDAGKPPLTSKKTIRVEVSDVNDNAPRFMKSFYTANVMENNVIGDSIFSLTAFDLDTEQNARLNFTILNSSLASYVSISSQDGVIFAQRSFDYEQLKNFQIQVQVQDSGVSPLSSNVSVDIVILDQNDNAPVIVHPVPEYGSTVMETISRSAEPGYLVAKVSATDADAGKNARLSYQIFQATHRDLFTISADTGEIWTIRRIESKDASKQRLVIVVKDNGEPSLSATVTIVLSVTGSETLSSANSLSTDPKFTPDLNLYLVIALGTTSIIFLVILVILAAKVHGNSNGVQRQCVCQNLCCCLQARNSLNGIQKASRSLQIPPNYVEVFGGDPFSQRFRYESCSTLQSVKRDFPAPQMCDLSTATHYVQKKSLGKENPEIIKPEVFNCKVNNEIRYSVPEELQPEAFVGNIAADLDLDVKQLTARRLRVAPGPGKQYFDVNLENGILFVKKIVDRELLCGSNPECRLSLDVVLENPLNLSPVEVEIIDINDNTPIFPKKQIRLEISETAAPGMRFLLEPAQDPDIGTNSLQSYKLQPNEYFTLDAQMRSSKQTRPVLLLEKSLDREKTSTHNLTLIAKDGGLPPRSGRVQIIIVVKDVNDNAPVFSQSVYRVSLLENIPKGTLIIRINATDPDDGVNGEVMYSFSSHISATARRLFDVNHKTGEITLKGQLDYEESSAIEINIQAMDKGPGAIPEYCDVLVEVIDVNDNVPEVTLRSSSNTISENAPLGTVVALFSVGDRDSEQNGHVHCQISNQLPFKLDSSIKNYYRILVQQLLDRETVPKYDITLICTDSGNPPLTSKKTIRVEVSDINDNTPKFSRSVYTANVMENNVLGASIFSVTAFDADIEQNARLNFSLLDSQVQNSSVTNYVSINSVNGVIYARRSYDHEQLKSFQIQVQVRDSGTPALISNATVNVVILDKNDNAPVIVHPLPEYGSTARETISRFSEPGCLVVKVTATDADSGQNARLSYQIYQATHRNLFTISTDTGELWTARRILNEDSSSQRLVLMVKDHGIPSLSATVTIVLTVIGTDSETLSTVSGSASDPKFIPELSLSLVIALGVISGIFLIILLILAVKVHKNRNGMAYQHRSLGTCCCFESRNSLNGIQKASKSLQISPNYVDVFGGDPLSQRFRYESCSTLQSTKREFVVPNRYGTSGEKNLVLREPMLKGNTGIVKSDSYAAPEVIELQLQFRNSVAKELQLDAPGADMAIRETGKLQPGAFVGKIVADLGLDVKQLSSRRLRIAPSARKQYFDVNWENGVLFVKEIIDRELLCGSNRDCYLSLNAVLENPPSLHPVEVEILDINDNAPSFTKRQFRLEIMEPATPGMRIPLEPAQDPDIGTNALKSYQIQPNEYFTLDVQSHSAKRKRPVLLLQKPLDRETKPSHNLTLIAKDGGVPPRSGTTEIIVTVKDVNDNAPVFFQPIYKVSLLESAPKGTLIIILNATDPDDGLNGEIMYSFGSHISASTRKIFDLNSKTGEIRLKGSLDYEETNVFEINIQAMDKGSGAIPGYCDVVVEIVDVNDNAPEISLRSSSSTVSEEDPPGTIVALFTAEDRDTGQNGQLECQISSQPPFQLDSSTMNYYRILIQHPLDRENVPRYDIAVTCIDSGNPPLTSTKTMRVEVLDINDNIPKFSRAVYTANVMENNVIGASIFSLTAFDTDAGENARLNFSILESKVQNSSVASFVSINSANGVIYAQRTFDYEQLKNFQIQVQVQDAGEPALKSNASVNVVILDQNDNAPVITHPLPEYGSTATETLSRFAEPGSFVVKVSASDADSGQNAQLTYQILQATQHNLFTISADTGKIWTIRRVLNKDASNQRLVIVVKDNGMPSLSATVTIVLSVIGTDNEKSSSASSSSADQRIIPELSLSLVIALGIISSIFLIILVILAIKVHKNRNAVVYQQRPLGSCCCFDSRDSLNGIQKASKSLQISPNYVEVFGGDPLSQRFRYESCSTLQSIKRDIIVPNNFRTSKENNFVLNESIGKDCTGMANFKKDSFTEKRLVDFMWSIKRHPVSAVILSPPIAEDGQSLTHLTALRYRTLQSYLFCDHPPKWHAMGDVFSSPDGTEVLIEPRPRDTTWETVAQNVSCLASMLTVPFCDVRKHFLYGLLLDTFHFFAFVCRPISPWRCVLPFGSSR
ncbi:protocadherin Fat 4-like [Hemitrygon akajei]|uniref:protocadherin Fat 4-like n=1 Tax=Hemitrygon akajei TaxID=2704970 RepID=UPI003BF97DB8